MKAVLVFFAITCVMMSLSAGHYVPSRETTSREMRPARDMESKYLQISMLADRLREKLINLMRERNIQMTSVIQKHLDELEQAKKMFLEHWNISDFKLASVAAFRAAIKHIHELHSSNTPNRDYEYNEEY